MESPARHLFTSESVTEGHPDKIADQISDSILDAIFVKDPMSRVACETLVTTGLAIVAGEISTTAVIDYQDVVRSTIKEVGYDRGKECEHSRLQREHPHLTGEAAANDEQKRAQKEQKREQVRDLGKRHRLPQEEK